jgi:hypothetical protein
MAFLNPFVLLGLAAAAIPILIHLFNFRRPQRLEFPSLRFVRELERKAMRRVRLRQWLLLALRTAALLALVLAFARPTLPSAWREAFGARPPAAVALVVDNSHSMALRDARGAYLDQARATAAALADAAPAGDALVLVPTAAPPGSPPGLAPTPAPVLDALDALEPRHGAEPVSAAIERAAGLLEGADQPRREVYVVSDLQAATLTDSVVAALAESPDGEGGADVRLTLVPVGERAHTNTAVTDVTVESRIVEPGRPVRIVATLARWGDAAEGVAARVLIEGEPVAEGAVDLRPGQPAVVRFAVTPPRPGWLRGEVRLAEQDDMRWDDAHPFVLEVPAARRVLLVRGAGQRADFVRLALALGAETGSVVVTEVDEGALPLGRLGDYEAVILLGPQRIAGGQVEALTRYVEGGGGVLLTPHERPDAAGYTALFRALGGGRLDGFVGALGGGALGGLGDADVEHPLLDGLLDDASGGRLESPEVAYAARYTPAGGDEATVARLAAGAPFLHEIRRGRGALLFLAVAPDPRWSDLPTRGLFAPLVLRSVAYLAGTGGGGGQDALVAGRPGTIRVEGADPEAPIDLVAPDGVALRPVQRTVPGAVLLDVEGVERPGVYAVRQGGRTLRLVAVGADPRESDPRTLTPEDAARRLEAATGREVAVLDARGAEGAAALEREGRGAPLWTVFVAIALLCLLAETAVATRWKPEREPA